MKTESRGLVLLLAYHFPPDNSIGGARPFRFYKYLKRLGYRCHVLTAVLQNPAVPDVQYVCDPNRSLPRRGLAWQAERVTWKFLLRGEATLAWSDAAWKAGKAILDRTRDEEVTIVSSAPPVGTHLAGWRLARYSGHPWIADFRDPIYHSVGERALLEPWVAPLVENTFLQSADLVLANTEAMRETWARRHPAMQGKLQTLWNGFDPEDAIVPAPLPERRAKILTHTGELYGGRDIRPILASAIRLVESGRIEPGTLTIRQVGSVDEQEMPEAETLRKGKALGCVEFQAAVPAAEARRLALDSDGLLLVQPHTALQVPGKLFDYLRMGRPVLAYIVKNSPIETILKQAGIPFHCIYPEQKPEEIDALLQAYVEILGRAPAAPSAWFERTFAAPGQTEQLDRLIRSLAR